MTTVERVGLPTGTRGSGVAGELGAVDVAPVRPGGWC
jgi:hypothetical protein